MKNKIIVCFFVLIIVLFFANISHGLGLFEGTPIEIDTEKIDPRNINPSKTLKDGGKYLSERGKALQNVTPEDFDCLNKNSECRKGLRHTDQQRLDITRDILGDAAGPLCVENSKVVSYRNRSKSTNNLSDLQYRYLKKYFGDIVDKVKFRWNSYLNDHITFEGRTLYQNSGAQTYGYNIYMKDKNFMDDISQIVLMAHELQHVKQYEKYGRSLDEYCGKYMSQWIEGGFRYNNIKMERESFKVEGQFESWIYKELKEEYDNEGKKVFGNNGYDPSQNPYIIKNSSSPPKKIESPETIRRKLEEEKRIKEEKERKKRRREVKKEMKQIDDEYSRLNSERNKNFSAPTVTPEMQSARERFEAFRNRNR